MATRTNWVDNKNIADKIFLRNEAVKNLTEVNVLDLFAGRNVLWSNIKTDKYFGVDLEKGKGKNLEADSKKIFDSLDLSKFNVIDVDSYGIDYGLYKKILGRKDLQKPCVVIYTLITHSLIGLNKSGIEIFNLNKIYSNAQGMFNEKSMKYFYNLLADYNIKKVNFYEVKDNFTKHYGYFVIK